MSGALGDLVVLDLTGAFWSCMGAALLGELGYRPEEIAALVREGAAATHQEIERARGERQRKRAQRQSGSGE